MTEQDRPTLAEGVRLDRVAFSTTSPTRIAAAQASHSRDRFKGHLVSPALTIRCENLQMLFQRVMNFETGLKTFTRIN